MEAHLLWGCDRPVCRNPSPAPASPRLLTLEETPRGRAQRTDSDWCPAWSLSLADRLSPQHWSLKSRMDVGFGEGCGLRCSLERGLICRTSHEDHVGIPLRPWENGYWSKGSLFVGVEENQRDIRNIKENHSGVLFLIGGGSLSVSPEVNLLVQRDHSSCRLALSSSSLSQ